VPELSKRKSWWAKNEWRRREIITWGGGRELFNEYLLREDVGRNDEDFVARGAQGSICGKILKGIL
jgi:hypothetical protein